jgi:hypothetical protein
MRATGVVCVVAVMLAASIGAGTTFAQAPVMPATTVADQSDVEVPEVPNVEVNVEVPNVEVNVVVPNVEVNVVVPNVEVNVEVPNVEKSGKPGDGNATPAKPKPTPQPKPAQPKSAEASAPPSAPPSEPGPEPQIDAAAKSVPPRPKAAPRVAAPQIRHGTTPGRPAPKESGTAARRPAAAASAERSATERAGSGRESADATPASSHRVAATPLPAPRLASEGAAAGASLARQQPRVFILDAREPGNATMLLALALTASVAFLLGREARRRPATGSRRSRPSPALNPLRRQRQSLFWHRRD